MRLTTFTLALCALFISTSLFAQQKVVVPMWDEAGHQWYAAFPQSQIASVPSDLRVVHDTETIYKSSDGKGPHAEGNTTISGSLTVTGNSLLGSGGGTFTENFGAECINYERPAVSTAIAILKDVTSIQDAGADVVATLPSAPPNGLSRRITIYNESATYNVTDGTNVLVAPGTHSDFVWVNGAWK